MNTAATHCPACGTEYPHFPLEFVQEQGTRFNCAHCGIDYLAFPSGLTVQVPIADDPKKALFEPVVIHGWDADRVQERQARQADALGIPLIFRDQLADGSLGPEMALIPSGIYLMGSPVDEPERRDDEGPQHPVTLARPFALGRCALTFAEWDAFADATGAYRPTDAGWGRGARPIINVGWVKAQAYLRWLADQTNEDYRLPSESEWEYACRAGTTTRFNTGHVIATEQANFDGNHPPEGCPTGGYLKKTAPVGSYLPNSLGLCEMHGNVREWVCPLPLNWDHA